MKKKQSAGLLSKLWRPEREMNTAKEEIGNIVKNMDDDSPCLTKKNEVCKYYTFC